MAKEVGGTRKIIKGLIVAIGRDCSEGESSRGQEARGKKDVNGTRGVGSSMRGLGETAEPFFWRGGSLGSRSENAREKRMRRDEEKRSEARSRADLGSSRALGGMMIWNEKEREHSSRT